MSKLSKTQSLVLAAAARWPLIFVTWADGFLQAHLELPNGLQVVKTPTVRGLLERGLLLSVTLFDDEASSGLTMGFGGCGRHCDVVVVSGDGGDCRGRHDDGGFRACGSTPARVLKCAGVGAGAGRG